MAAAAIETTEQVVTLSPEQERAISLVLEGKSVFITGPGGTGKTFLCQPKHHRRG
jgi:phosphate starvation-inducible protein PhoH